MTDHEKCIELLKEAESYGWKLANGDTEESYVTYWEETKKIVPSLDVVNVFEELVEHVKKW